MKKTLKKALSSRAFLKSILPLLMVLLVVPFINSNVATAHADNDHHTPPPPQTGSITICKVIEDANGNIINGSQFPGITFVVPGTSPVKNATFTTPTSFNGAAFSGSNAQNAQCVTQSGLALDTAHGGNTTYHYLQETISSSTGWLAPLYSDNHPHDDSNLSSFGNSHADGSLVISPSHPDATLIVLNQRSALDLCFSTSTQLNSSDDEGHDDDSNHNAPAVICPAKLTVVKTVINDNGGTKQVSDFPLFVGTTSVSSTIQKTFTAGTYAVTETASAGYAATFGGDCDATGHVTLHGSDVKTCTITNNDIQPQIIVTKVVDNTGGGTKQVSDFPLFVGTTSVTSGHAAGINAGSYYVHENGNDDHAYIATFSGDCADGLVTLGIGQVKYCTMTNTFVPPVAPACLPTDIVSDVTNMVDGTNATATTLTFIHPAWTATFPNDPTNLSSWIWNLDPVDQTQNNETHTFDKTFTVNGNVASATLDIAADNFYVVRVNGTQVGSETVNGNSFDVNNEGHYDVASLLHPGTNTISVDVTNLGVPGSDPTSNPAGLRYDLHIVTDCSGSVAQQIKVHIYKFLTNASGTDPVQATADNANGYLFPMVSTWKTANLNGGVSTSGNYELGDNYGGAPVQYEADTSPMAQPSDYTTSEVTGGTSKVLPIGSEVCTPGDYQLLGYGSGNDLAGALTSGVTSTPIAFTGITTDKTIVVYNMPCPPAPPAPQFQVKIFKFINGIQASAATANSASFPMITTYSAANIGSGTDVPFSIGPVGFNATSAYEADTSFMSAPANYTASEITGGESNVLPEGATCTPGAFRLDGYKSGDDVASALAGDLSPTAPQFTGITSGKVILVMNEICPSTNDFSITKTVDNTAPIGGANVTYTLTVTNSGPADATGVLVNDELPDGLTFVSSVAPEGTSYSSSTGVWTIGTLPADSSVVLTITANVDAADEIGTVITNTANVDESYGITDTNSSNDSASAKITVTSNNIAPPGGGDTPIGGGGSQSAEVAITKSVSNTTPAYGSNVTYTITVSALGPYISLGVTAKDLLPAGLSFVSANAQTGSYASSTGIWTIGTMFQNTSTTLTIVAKVTGASGTKIANLATVSESSSVVDPLSGNDTSTATITVGGEVLGASTSSTSTSGYVLGASTTAMCSDLYLPLNAYMGYGRKNNSAYVTLLQKFLNNILHLNLTVNGTFDKPTFAAVKLFQKTYGKDVLAPWVPYGLSNNLPPTGYVYKTTLRWIDLLNCEGLNIPIPQLP